MKEKLIFYLEKKMSDYFTDEELSVPIEEGQVTRISLLRGSCDLGMSIIGGCDTPLVSYSLDYHPLAADGTVTNGHLVISIVCAALRIAALFAHHFYSPVIPYMHSGHNNRKLG